MKKLFRMFFIFFKIGAFTLGGGYAMIPFIEEEIVEKNKWIDAEEFIDIIALSQTIPGAFAVNASTYIGYRLFGFPGALLGCLGTMLPSIIIITLIAAFFVQFRSIPLLESVFSGIRPAVAALILVAVMKLGKPLPKNLWNLTWVGVVTLLVTVFGFHPILVMILSGALGYFIFKGEKTDENTH
ncbi:chromate transporter [Thermotalea metallivorans]|uniref:Putative chromate transport protein n=1 Tax=Thermotalea metallivorans TaxID=520762 RepID=A0A140L7G3_9FIRM|nr:chromate transporter [Thermotalea metallivorans]KXG76488.1 putative chromate transport protein [Thermotalea metallivorans]